MDPCCSGRQHVITPSSRLLAAGKRASRPVRQGSSGILAALGSTIRMQQRPQASASLPVPLRASPSSLASNSQAGSLLRVRAIRASASGQHWQQQQQRGDAACGTRASTNNKGDVSTAAFADGYPEAAAAAAAATVRDEVVDYLEHAAVTDAASSSASSSWDSSAAAGTDVSSPGPLHKPRFLKWLPSGEDELKAINYSINLGLLLLFGAAALTKIVTVGSDQWGVRSLWEVVSSIPGDNWALYEAAVESNPMFTKACISGAVYSLGDLTAQTYEGRSLDDFDRGRVLRSGVCGFVAHGPLSHLYYENLDALFNGVLQVDPDSWYQPLAKVAIDQTVWSLFWNSAYYVLLGALKFESPEVIVQTVKSSWWDLLKAGWRLWPFAHVVTYGVIPVQHRLLWVDSVELVWVTILSLYGQQQRERLAEAAAAAGVEGTPVTQVASALPGAGGQGGDAAEEILRGIRAEREVVVDDGRGHRTVVDIKQVYAEQAAARKEAAAAEAAAAAAVVSADASAQAEH